MRYQLYLLSVSMLILLTLNNCQQMYGRRQACLFPASLNDLMT